MRKIYAAIVAVIVVILCAGAASADYKYFPQSGTQSVSEASQWELERRQAQDAFERVAEMASFSLDFHPGDSFYAEDGMLYELVDNQWEEIGETDYRDGQWTLLNNLDFQHEDGEIVVTEDESTYTVKPNDGWWVISKRTGIPMSTLMNINNNTPLHPGTVLKVYMDKVDDSTSEDFSGAVVSNDSPSVDKSRSIVKDGGETLTEGYRVEDSTRPVERAKSASRTNSTDARFPDTGALSVDEAAKVSGELERRQAQDTSERISELAYFGIKFGTGDSFKVKDSIIIGPDGMAVGSTDVLYDGTYILTDDFTFAKQ